MYKFAIIFLGLITINLLRASTLEINETNVPECENSDSICYTPGCVHCAADILKNLNKLVDPCDNFYEFACGGFPKNHDIPDDYTFLISFTIISDRVENQIKNAMEEPIQENEPRSFAIAKSLYNLCLDVRSIEENGIEPINSILRRLGGFPVIEGTKWKEENFNWKTTVYNIQNEGFFTHTLMIVYVGLNIMNSSERMINIDQAQLPLNRENLIQGFENDIVKAYYNYIVEVAVILGANQDNALRELREVVEFEIELAKITIPQEERRNVSLLTNQMTVQELQDRFNSIPWMEYINNIIKEGNVKINLDDVVDLGVPKYVTALELLLNRTSERIIHNHLILHIVTSSVPFSTKSLRKLEQKFKQIYQGTISMRPRWKECVDVVNNGLRIATSALYVRKYFHEEAKENAEQLVKDVRHTFHDILNNIDWMDQATKSKAIDKARAITAHVAYPQELMDEENVEEYYSKLNISSANFLESALRLKKFMDYKSMSKLREVVNKTDWTNFGDAVSINAYYSASQNSILLPAGILQGAFFDNDRPNYMNYGSMGFVIGHELTHGFDDVGRQFDKNGEMVEWWGEETKQLFMQKAQCIIDQYNNYLVPEVNMTLNGINTQGENIADNGGIKEAYLAYEKWIERNGEEPQLPGLNYTPKQMFWISSANLWCINVRNEFLRQQVLTDEHSPSHFRVIGSVSNSEYFSKDFNCPKGSPMNPIKKCHVW